MLAQADTVSEADIRTIYAGQPGVVPGAVAAFNARREVADRQVVMSHDRADAADELRAALDALAPQAEELARRELEAEHQRVRSNLGAAWARERADLNANRAERMDSLYGAFPLHSVFGGTP